MDKTQMQYLQDMANRIRINAVTAVYSAKSGHPGGSLSIADVLSYLYFKEMNIDPKNPRMEDRDRLSCPRATVRLPSTAFWH